MQLTFISLTPEDLRLVIREEVERAVGQPQSKMAAPSQYLSLAQAAQQHKVSKSYLYRLSSERAVGTRRVGKSIQFDAKELEAHFNKTTRKSKTAVDDDLKQHGVFPTLKGKRHV